MKAKNILFSIAASAVLFGFTCVSAVTIDSQIEDELNEKAQQEMIKNAQTKSIVYTPILIMFVMNVMKIIYS